MFRNLLETVAVLHELTTTRDAGIILGNTGMVRSKLYHILNRFIANGLVDKVRIAGKLEPGGPRFTYDITKKGREEHDFLRRELKNILELGDGATADPSLISMDDLAVDLELELQGYIKSDALRSRVIKDVLGLVGR